MAKWYQKAGALLNPVGAIAGSSGVRDFVGDAWNDVTGVTQGRAANKATNALVEQQRLALEEQKRQFDQSQANLAPWLQTGQRALGSLEQGVNSGAYSMPDLSVSNLSLPQFSFSQTDFQNDPGYRFQMQEGARALDSGAAARGGALGGNQMRALTQFGQGLASTEYGNAYNRAANTYGMNTQNALATHGMNTQNQMNAYGMNAQNRQNQFGRYSQLAGLGQASGAQMGQFGANYANQAANAYGNIGNAQASGIVGAANARAQGTGNLLNLGANLAGLYFGGR